VLVVEDDEAIRDSVVDILEVEGYSVASAGNGREALDVLAQSQRPCVVLLDLMMPEMDGWEFVASLRSDSCLSTIPVVVTTATSAAPPGGVALVLRKPIRVDALLDAVAAHCARASG
jgi:two-component system chemotaxis response regulator CheY